MAHGTPEQVAQAWAQRLGASTQKITAGVEGVRVAPGQAAARQQDVWAANVAAAKSKWATRVAAVSLADWQTAMTTKGVQRIAAGASAAEGKFAQAMARLLPIIDSIRTSLPARGDLEANINRSATFARQMASQAAARRG